MPGRIVICDDAASVTRAVSMKLSRAGYQVETAADGERGWEIVSRDPPDLLITDCQMPGINGLELTERLRSRPATAEVPVILLTAKAFELDEARLSNELGVSHLVFKPFSPRELLEIVEATLHAPAIG